MLSNFSINRILIGNIVFLALLCFSLRLAGQQEPSKIHLVVDSMGITSRVEIRPQLLSDLSPSVSLTTSADRINALSITATSTGATCELPNGTIVALASGGTEPYKYRLDGGQYYNTGNFPTVLPGNHVVEVKDATGLLSSQNVVVSNSFSPPRW